ETIIKEWEDRMERAATTASCLVADVDAQTKFKTTFKKSNDPPLSRGYTLRSGEDNGQLKTITEASLRRHLKLEDVDGISSLPNNEIFKQLALMRYASASDKLTFQKGHFSPQWRFLIHTILHCLSPKKTAWEQFSSNIATAIICLATNRTFNFSKMIFEGMVKNLDSSMLVQGPIQQGKGSTVPVESHHIPITTSSTSQPPLSSPSRVPTPPYDPPLLGGHILGSDEGRMQHTELIDLVIKVKRLEKIVKSSKARRRAKIVVSDDKKVSEDSSKQGRMIDDIDQDARITLVTPTKTTRVHTYSKRRTVSTGSGEVSTSSRIISNAKETVSTAGASMPVSTAGLVQEITSSSRASKDKEDEWENIRARVEADEELTQKLQEEEREKYSEVDQAKMLVELINQRKRFFAQQRAEAKRNKPMTQAQQRTYMSNYIKNQEEGYSIKQLKSLSFEEVKEIFETNKRRLHSFVPVDSELEVQRLKRAGQEVLEEPAKRQKIREALGSGEEQSAEKEKEVSEEELQKLLVIVPVEEVYIESIQVKYPIIDWEIFTKESRSYWRIIRFGNHIEVYQIFEDMLKRFDRDELEKLCDLVKKRFKSTEPTVDKEKVLWVELKRLFKPDDDDTLWKLQRYMHDLLK
ncbi:hypothetical protein Tco_0242656, partial [Tanacetum coccineum]